MIIQLFDATKTEIIASDGIMHVNSRKDISMQVRERNARFAQQFPHKIAHFWAKSTLRTAERYKKSHSGKLSQVI